MSEYRYNASDDPLTAWNRMFTSRIGDGSGDPEEEYFSTLKLVTACKPRASLLDIGCGLGRVSKFLRNDVAAIVGLEPDVERFTESHAALHDGNRIHIINGTSSRYKVEHPERRHDIVIVSMVIQHVPTGTCDAILADVRDLLDDDGIGVIATTQQDEERFTCQHDPTPRSQADFDQYASDSSGQRHGIPVRQFSKASFLSALNRAGLDRVHWGQFSYVRPDKVAWLADLLRLVPASLQDVGTSQVAVVRRRCS